VNPDEDAKGIAEAVFAELTARDDLHEVGYAEGTRYRLRAVPAALEASLGGSLDLDASSLVLITGGARGITAGAAVELARRTGCKLALVGRSALPGPEDSGYEQAEDLPALRKAIIAEGSIKDPRSIEAKCRRIMAAREVRRTLDALRTAGSDFEYHPLDVRDSEAFGRLIDDLYARHGRIDGVIHGAGIIEDKLMLDKSKDSFDRVFDTKVSAARVLEARLRDDVRFVVFFSSVSGAFGNRGQTDYAAAGDVLDKLAVELQRRIKGRVVSIDWGPWAGTGMVSRELAREYARQGVGLIPVDEGIERLFQELGSPSRDAQVILMAAKPSTMA
jgi:NAD(P)-dependent dehydrogenase (short-subunit alcohol dehydrogenase family)